MGGRESKQKPITDNEVLPYVRAIERHYECLRRCTDVNLFVIACLRSQNPFVLDLAQESDLTAERSLQHRVQMLYSWLKASQDVSKYERFLRVMEHKDVQQQHVANLLRGTGEEDLMPMSDARYLRLQTIRPRLSHAIKGVSADVEILHRLSSSGAISNTDFSEIDSQMTEYKKSFLLITAIMRRSNRAYDLFKKTLIEAKREHLAVYLSEGEMPVVHVTTTRPDLDADLSDAFNSGVIAEPQLFSELVERQLHPVTSRPGHSIEIFIYCQNEQHMETFIEVFISGQLETYLRNILNRLLLKIKPNAERLEITISIDIEEVLAIEEYTGIEDWIKDKTMEPTKIQQTADLTTERQPVNETDLGALGSDAKERKEKLLEILDSDERPRLRALESAVMTKKIRLLESDEGPGRYVTEVTANLSQSTQPSPDGSNSSSQVYRMRWLNTLELSKLSKQSPVQGITVLKGRIYVIYLNLSTMEVYYCKTNAFVFRKQVAAMKHPKDIASCPLSDCLYILNTLSDYISMTVVRIDSSKAVAQWDVPSESSQISVFEGNIIISLFSNCIPEIKEYNCHGSLIRTITLQMSTELFYSWQVLKIPDECYVCFLAYLGANTITTDLFLLTNDGKKLKSLKSVISKEDRVCEARQKLLAIDINRNIILSDSLKNKFWIFDSNLENREEISSELIMPDIIVLDEYSEHLFALNKQQASVQVFSLKQQLLTKETPRKHSGPKAADIVSIPSSVQTSVLSDAF